MTKIAVITGEVENWPYSHHLLKIFCLFSRSELFKKYSNFKSVKIDITDEDQVSLFFKQIKNINLR